MNPAYRGLGVMWCEYKPAKGQSPRTPKKPSTGDSQATAPPAQAAQTADSQPLAAESEIRSPDASHHPAPPAGDAPMPAIKTVAGDATPSAATASDNSPRRLLADGDIERAFVYIACGYSLRAAAAEIGRHHTTLLKRIKNDPAVRDAFRAAQEKARNEPLARIREASQSSWRAAAWYVQYLDARERRGGRRTGRNCGNQGENGPH